MQFLDVPTSLFPSAKYRCDEAGPKFWVGTEIRKYLLCVTWATTFQDIRISRDAGYLHLPLSTNHGNL